MKREFFGYGSISNLQEIIDSYKAKNVFLVTGKKSYKLSGAEKTIKPFLKDLKYTHYNQFSANPDIKDVKNGIELYKKVNPDLVIAIGGGSVLDIAKAISVLSDQDNEPVYFIKGEKKLEKKGKPIVAIPATAGTGSEATRFSTIYIDKKKYSLSHEKFTLPSFSIIDPSLTESMPQYLTAVTGLDALCQAIESIWSVNSTNESERFAEQAVKLAFNNIKKAVKNPDKESRLNMAKAANLSGKAINISKTTACHSISYPITSFFDIAHGHAVVLTMPEIIEFNYNVSISDCNDKRGVEFVKKQMDKIFKLLDAIDEKDAKNKFYDLMKEIDVKTKLSDFNIDKKGVELIIKEGFTPDRMNNNPRKITKQQLNVILERIL